MRKGQTTMPTTTTEKPVVVKQGNPANPLPDEVLAEHIKAIGTAMQNLMNGPLKEDTIILLVHDYTKIARRDIGVVLRCLKQLRGIYLK